MADLHRRLAPGQQCVVHRLDVAAGRVTELFRTDAHLLEAPNWLEADTLLLNGEGALWRLSVSTRRVERLSIPGLPELNNDHVPAPDGRAVYVSAFDWHIHRVGLSGGPVERVTRDEPELPLLRFLHGVSPDGSELAFVGLELRADGPPRANIFTVPSVGGPVRRLTGWDAPSDGPEYSPDGGWIYFNTEAFGSVAGHAQIARMRTDGTGVEQLTADERVNWFPHLAPDGRTACYLSYPPGTEGHPADLDVELKLVVDDRWGEAETVVRLFGGQGTVNVNSWSPDSSAFAFVSYPFAEG